MRIVAVAPLIALATAGCASQPTTPRSPELVRLYSKPNVFESIPRTDWIAESPNAYVVRDTNPKAPIHLLVIPKARTPTLLQASPALLGEMFELLKRTAKQEGIDESGFRTVINTHPDSRQSVYQLHIHILGGRKMDWTDGFTDAASAMPPSR